MEWVPKSTFGGQKSGLGQRKIDVWCQEVDYGQTKSIFGGPKPTLGHQNRLLVAQKTTLRYQKTESWCPKVKFGAPKSIRTGERKTIWGMKDNMMHEEGQYEIRIILLRVVP